MSDPNHVVHADDVPWSDGPSHGDRFGSRMRSLGRAAGGRKLGCNLYEVPPGRTAFPMHAHLGTEEAIYVLEGEGTLRLGTTEHAVRAGSYAAFLADPDFAHQLINTGSEPLRYLCFSDHVDPEIVLYPDSRKTALAAGGWPAKVRKIFFDEDAGAGYFDRE